MPEKKLPEGFHALVIGGGLGGLAAALRLNHAGARVTLIEKEPALGGKAGEFRLQGYRWDTGPSLLTLPGILDELFSDIGLSRADLLPLERLDPLCRYFWPDGTSLDEDRAFFQQPEVAAFLQHAHGIWELSGEAYLRHPPREFWRAFTPANWPKLVHLPKIATLRTLAREVDARVSDPRLRQYFKRFATYNGSDPRLTPAAFGVIPYTQAHFGGWHPPGGIHRIVQTLAHIARERGVKILFNTPVIRCDEHGVETAGGKRFTADAIVVNGDVIRAHLDWLRYEGWRHLARRYLHHPLSLSGFVLLLGVRHRYPQLLHHNIFFSKDYDAEFDELFEKNTFPTDPTLYLNISARTDPADAPDGCDNLFVMANVPAEIDHLDWDRLKEPLATVIIGMLEQRGLTHLRQHIECRTLITPLDFARRHQTAAGALYGWASHGITPSLLRPPICSPLSPRLFFAGGTTHPGGGIPLVLLSAHMAARAILRRFGQ